MTAKPALTEALVVDLTQQAKGVAHIDGKTVFIAGALTGERVRFQLTKRKRDYDEAKLTEILQVSPDRLDPACPHFQLCGACQFQHLAPRAQIELKQKILLDNLQRIAKLQPQALLPPITGQSFGYRRRARLGVKFVKKKAKVLVGFREKGQGRFLAELDICLTLAGDLGRWLPELGRLIFGLDCYQHIPQIEVASGDANMALVFRHLQSLSDSDNRALSGFGQESGWHIYTQARGPDSIVALWPQQPDSLYYCLPLFGVKLLFQPLDFIQVNQEINQKLVTLALELLNVQSDELVLDLFCGLGNFSLPLARQSQRVIGMEGDLDLVQRGRANAQLNDISNVIFQQVDLQQAPVFPLADKILIDPPRCGAQEVLAAVASSQPKKIVYVSCNPATLARDAGILCHEYGMQLTKTGVLDMFPHTSHVESIALFEPS